MRSALLGVLTNPAFLIVWGILVVGSLGVLIRDLSTNNRQQMSLMKVVWGLTVLYSGPIGLLVYWMTGRKEIAEDTLWRRGWRSTAHCYSGCGMGEVVGVIIAAGLLSLGNWPIAIITFLLAYAFGFALTAGPLIQDGEPVHKALWDAFASETASITVMEVTAIAIDLWLGGKSTIGEARFWASMVFSLSMGLLAAYPVNLLLIHFGIKEGMHSPKEMAHAHA